MVRSGVKMENILEKIHRAGQNLAQPLNAEDTYAMIIRDLFDLAGTSYGSIFLWKDGVLERVYASHPNLYTTRVRRKGYTTKASLKLVPSFISISTIKNIHPSVVNLGVKSILYLPLLSNGKSIGVISLDSVVKDDYSQKELDLFKLYSAIASLAILKTELFNETRQALEIRDFFISTAAHELRTPLTAINGYVQLLNKRMQNTDSLESRWVGQLMHETQRLTTLTKELVEVNKIRAGVAEYILKEQSLIDIIKRTINRLQYHYPNKAIQFETTLNDTQDVLIADYDKLIQVFYNILDNAIKYSPENEAVSIYLVYKKPYLVVKISDKGRGISQERLKQIFNGNFHTVDDGSEKTGIGLGLFLIKNIIEKHNGEITIKSTKDKGTTVFVKLPAFKSK